MFQSRTTTIEGHNKYPKVDQLYEPLRKTFLADTTARKTQLQEASHMSHLSHRIKTHTLDQNIELAHNTLIFLDAKLHPTHNTWKLPKDTKYYIVNVQQKVYQPISQEELNILMANRNEQQEQVIVYTIQDQQGDSNELQNQIFQKRVESFNYVDEPKVSLDRYSIKKHDTHVRMNVQQGQKTLNKTKFENKTIQQNKDQSDSKNIQPQRPLKVLKTKKGSGIIVTQPKYNLFSALDEAVNNILDGKSCTCPSNQLVASNLNQISWYGTIGR